MPEGVAAGGTVLAGAVHDDPDHQPEPGREAPRGWTWDRANRAWKAKIRGPILWFDAGDGGQAAAPAPAPAPEPGSGRDPAPAWQRDDDTPAEPEGPLKYEDVPKAVKDDIAGLMGLVGTPILGILQHADPYCGGALADCFEPAVDATLPLICRSSKIVNYFREDKSDWLLWGKLAMALSPVMRAVAEHHVFRSVEIVRDKDGVPQYTPAGELLVRDRVAGEGSDHLQPAPQPSDPIAYVA